MSTRIRNAQWESNEDPQMMKRLKKEMEGFTKPTWSKTSNLNIYSFPFI